jgi:hypothetical protein
MEMNTAVKVPGVWGNIKSKGSAVFSGISLFFFDKPYFTSLLMALLLFFPILCFFKIYFQLNDDYWALFLLKGTVLDRAPSAMNLIENIWLCLGLKDLYLKFPVIQWYAWFFIAAQLLSLWAILAAFQLGSHRFFKTLIFVISSIALEIHFFDCLQWTVVATLSSIGAALLLAAVWRRDDWKYSSLAFGLAFVLISIAILIRFETVVLMGLVLVPTAVYLFWKAKMSPVRWAIMLFLLFMAGFSFYAVAYNRDYYNRDPDWREALQILNQHGHLTDLRNPVYDQKTKPVFDSVGWSANDFHIFMSNYFMDKVTYSVEKLNAYFPQFGMNKDQQDSFQAMFLNLRTPLAILFLFSIFPFLLDDFWFVLSSGAWTILVLLFCEVYLKMPERIYLPCLYFQNNIAIFFVSLKTKDTIAEPRFDLKVLKLGVFYLSFIFIFSLYLAHMEYVRNRSWTQQEVDLKKTMGSLKPQDDQLFVIWGSAFPYEKIDAFDMDFLKHFHVVELAWFQRTPTTRAMLDWFGYKNLFKEMVGASDVFFICTPYQYSLYYSYMLEKYKMKTYGLAVFRSKQFNVYSVHRARK